MARFNTVSFSALGADLSLVPERYDPLRFTSVSAGVPVAEVAQIVSQTAIPSNLESGTYVILDTTHAFAGVVNMAAYSAAGASTLSNKKTAAVGDVIVSRLRPYLKQVAYLDKRILSRGAHQILCSTEFFVLRSVDPDESISYLVPFLLSKSIQTVLAASQEGGHHPRFNAETLMSLCIPKKLFEHRREISQDISSAVETFRDSEMAIAESVFRFDSLN